MVCIIDLKMIKIGYQHNLSYGNFLFLGMPFYQAVHILKRQDRNIKGVQIWYSDQV